MSNNKIDHESGAGFSREFVFGPVPSRRLGRSLGVDLIPHKTCSYDCVYCESGRTTVKTFERREYFPLSSIIGELDAVLAAAPELDYITFSGAGEPTLHSGIGALIRHLKGNWAEYRLCLITNGSLLVDRGLREELSGLDLIIPSLDAAIPEIFEKINRPPPGFELHNLINAYRLFREENDVDFWLEVFIVPGLNDGAESIRALAEAVAFIVPDKVQLNMLDRPAPEDWVKIADMDSLMRFQEALAETGVPVELIGKLRLEAVSDSSPMDLNRRIVELVRRRPCTSADLELALGVKAGKLQAMLEKMLLRGLLKSKSSSRGVFYLAG